MSFLIPGKLTMALIAAAVLVVAIGGTAFWLRYDAAKDARQKDREATIQREKDISEGISACAGLPWYERLQCKE